MLVGPDYVLNTIGYFMNCIHKKGFAEFNGKIMVNPKIK